jgi:hypothetical protein
MASGLSQASQYRSAANVADANAQRSNAQISDAIQRGTIERQQLDRKYAGLAGSQQAAMASNGIDLGFGSAAQVAGDTQMMRNEDAASLYSNENNEIKGFDTSTSNFRAEAAAKRSAAKGAIIAAAFGAASSALGGASQFGSMKGKLPATSSTYGISGSDGIY